MKQLLHHHLQEKNERASLRGCDVNQQNTVLWLMRARLSLFVSQECDMGDQISCLIWLEITAFVCKQ